MTIRKLFAKPNIQDLKRDSVTEILSYQDMKRLSSDTSSYKDYLKAHIVSAVTEDLLRSDLYAKYLQDMEFKDMFLVDYHDEDYDEEEGVQFECEFGGISINIVVDLPEEKIREIREAAKKEPELQ